MMLASSKTKAEERVLVVAPWGRDASLIGEVLEKSGVHSMSCGTGHALDEELSAGAAAVLLTEEALTAETVSLLVRVLKAQPTWSDLPLVVLVDDDPHHPQGLRAVRALAPDRGITILTRPLRVPTLVTVMQAALRARHKQYQVRELLAQLEQRVAKRTAELFAANEQVKKEIAERLQVEAALRESEAQFSRAFHASPAATLVIRLSDLCYLDVNQSFLRMSGYGHDEIIGRASRGLALLVDAEQRELDVTRLAAAASPLEVGVRTKSGRLRHVLASGEIIDFAESACLLSAFIDITERKQTEEELMQAIQAVMQDAAWFSRSVIQKMAQLKSGEPTQIDMAELSERERQVLALVAKGWDNGRIAKEMGLAKQTVNNYLTRIYEKLNLHSRAEAVVWARERGLVDL